MNEATKHAIGMAELGVKLGTRIGNDYVALVLDELKRMRDLLRDSRKCLDWEDWPRLEKRVNDVLSEKEEP